MQTKRLAKLEAKLKAAISERTIRMRSKKASDRGYAKVQATIAMLEERIENARRT